MSVMKAIEKAVGRAATAVQEDDVLQQYYNKQTWSNIVASNTANQRYWPNTTASTTTTAVPVQMYYPTIGGGGAPGVTSSGYAQTGYSALRPTIEFTDEQRESFLAKMADLLTRGWECLRCHRIWSPQVNGCEFCNFIDRLEGKDVERDTA